TFSRADTPSTAIGQAHSANSIRRHCPSEISTSFRQDPRSAPDRKDGCVREKSGGKQEGQTASGLCSRLRNLPPVSRSAFPVTLAGTAREVCITLSRIIASRLSRIRQLPTLVELPSVPLGQPVIITPVLCRSP